MAEVESCQTLTSAYLNKLFNYNAIQEYTFKYTNEHNEELEDMNFNDFYNTFEVTDNMISQLISTGISNGVNPDYQDLKKSEPLIKLHVKAQIARQIWNNDGFYPIFNQTNEVLEQAAKLFDKAEELDRTKF